MTATLVVGVCWPSPPGAARRRPRPPPAATPWYGARPPRVVAVYRQKVRAFALAAERLNQLTPYPVKRFPLDPKQPPRDLREDIRDEKPEIVVALGPFATQLLSRGVGQTPVLFAYLTRPPTATVRRGGWVAQGADPGVVLRWVARIRPMARRIGVVTWDPSDPLLADLRRVCGQGRCTPLAVHARTPRQVLGAVFKLLKQRPDVIWLGHHVEPYTPAVLHQLTRLQSLTRVPLVGLTSHHVRRGLLCSVDASPDAVARTVARMIRGYGPNWLSKDRRAARRPRRRGGKRRRKPKRARSAVRSAEAAPLVRARVAADRVTVNPRVAQILGVDLGRAIRAGASPVKP